MNEADENVLVTQVRAQIEAMSSVEGVSAMARRTYQGKILKAVHGYADPLERAFAGALTRTSEVGVLRGLRRRVDNVSQQLTTATEREVALRALETNPGMTPEELIAVAKCVALEPAPAA